MKILAVETSAVAASAALCEDDFLLGEFFTNTRRVHSQTLMPMVQALLQNCTVKPEEIGLYAVAAGPGSFTGVRIGVSAVKGMAMARNTPCAAVSSLEAAACNAASADGLVCAVMDARCGQVYRAVFEAKDGVLRRLTEDEAVSLEILQKELVNYKKNCLLVGDGAKICYNHCRMLAGLRMMPASLLYPRASSVAALAYSQYVKGNTLTASALQPVYLRLPQAERERRERLQAKQKDVMT